MYENFLVLHVAISLLAAPGATTSEIQYAGDLLKCFVSCFTEIYGQEHVTHNVHGLSHLASDVQHLGCLDDWSAFPFENHMATLKRMLRKPEYPLEQLCNRLSEQGVVLTRKQKVTCYPLFTAPHNSGPLIEACQGPQFLKVTLSAKVSLAVGNKNSCCILSDGSVIIVKNFAHFPSGEPCVIGRKFHERRDLYSLPCPSTMLRICTVSQLSCLRSWPLHCIAQKCFKIIFKRETIIFPLLHAVVL